MRWSEQVAATTGVAWGPGEMDMMLDLVREVAHGVERRYGPLTAYAVGVAPGQRLGGDADTPEGRAELLASMAEELTAAARELLPD